MAVDPKLARLKGITSQIALTGTDDEIKTQLSLLLGISQISEAAIKGLDFNFQRWIEDFEDGFKSFEPRLNKALNPGNWGQKVGERPKVRILKETKEFWANDGYYLVEFLPNREDLEESYLLFGTPLQLMQQLLERMNRKLEPKGEEMFSIPVAYFGETVTTVPQVILRFRESRQDAFKNKRYKNPIQSRFYVRVRQDFSSETAIESLKKKIETIFVNPTFGFNKGRIKYSYLGKEKKPIHVIAATGENQAKSVIRNLLLINDEKPQWTTLTESTSNKNFDVKETFKVAGKQYTRPNRRPIAKVWFISAELHIDGLMFNRRLVDLGKGANAGKWPK